MCIEVKLTTDVYADADAKDISWSFGPCDSDRQPNGEQEYEDHKEYSQTCCFNTAPDNWVFELKCNKQNIRRQDKQFVSYVIYQVFGILPFPDEKVCQLM